MRAASVRNVVIGDRILLNEISDFVVRKRIQLKDLDDFAWMILLCCRMFRDQARPLRSKIAGSAADRSSFVC